MLLNARRRLDLWLSPLGEFLRLSLFSFYELHSMAPTRLPLLTSPGYDAVRNGGFLKTTCSPTMTEVLYRSENRRNPTTTPRASFQVSSFATDQN